ncbi:hypothetical protein AHOG_21115 [Actinoalloteichus hoggarensis]|uniref:Uncharacterized protein n=1 Tax=Actinoalloteichus hoggarensis TaxID=1470176 RepID=A0A221W8I6_9PSEU|nr:hypothetical protein AHOG_21115 [Actinoalloteichus hoggarensis]
MNGRSVVGHALVLSSNRSMSGTDGGRPAGVLVPPGISAVRRCSPAGLGSAVSESGGLGRAGRAGRVRPGGVGIGASGAGCQARRGRAMRCRAGGVGIGPSGAGCQARRGGNQAVLDPAVPESHGVGLGGVGISRVGISGVGISGIGISGIGISGIGISGIGISGIGISGVGISGVGLGAPRGAAGDLAISGRAGAIRAGRQLGTTRRRLPRADGRGGARGQGAAERRRSVCGGRVGCAAAGSTRPGRRSSRVVGVPGGNGRPQDGR